MSQTFRLPPYGRILLAYQQESIPLDFSITIFVGNRARELCFNYKKAGSMASYLPDGENFESFNWPIRNQKIIVSYSKDVTPVMIKLFCLHLLTFSPRVIFYSDGETNHQLFTTRTE